MDRREEARGYCRRIAELAEDGTFRRSWCLQRVTRILQAGMVGRLDELVGDLVSGLIANPRRYGMAVLSKAYKEACRALDGIEIAGDKVDHAKPRRSRRVVEDEVG